MRGVACSTLRGGANWWSVVTNIYTQAGLGAYRKHMVE